MKRPKTNGVVVAVLFRGNIWIPPTGRPYWVNVGAKNAGPHLTDEQLKQFGLTDYLDTTFSETWAESCRL